MIYHLDKWESDNMPDFQPEQVLDDQYKIEIKKNTSKPPSLLSEADLID